MSATLEHTQTDSWDDVLNRQVRILHAQIAEVINVAGEDKNLAKMLSAPYYKLLEKLYQEDFPVARAIDESDLVIQLEGEAVDERNPRLSLISTVFSNVRRQVGTVAYAISGLTESHRKTLPKEVDLSMTAFAQGSLYLGFSLPDPDGENEDGAKNILGKDDPLYKATKQAIHTLGVVSRNLDENKSSDEMDREIPDPRVRDRAIAAIQRLSPTGRAGITRIGIAGRSIEGHGFSHLSPKTRISAKQLIDRPMTEGEHIELVGIIREMDLDIKRFELRRIAESAVEEIRCIYRDENTSAAKHAFHNEKQVRATGIIQRSPDGKPKLFQVENLTLVSEENVQRAFI